MRFHPRSLRAIVVVYVGVIFVALLAVRTTNSVIVHDALNRAVDRRLEEELRDIAGPARDAAIATMTQRIAAKQTAHETADLLFLLRDPAGRPVAGALRLPTPPTTGFSDFGDIAGVDGVAHGRALVERVTNGASLTIVSDNDVVDGFDALLLQVQLASLAVALLVFAGGAAAIVWEVSRRLRAMQHTVNSVMAGNLASRVPVDGSGSEFDRQATAFNAMLDRIDALMANVKHAARDVAHELKSPLARLRNRVAGLERHARDTRFGADSAAILAETDELLELFASLMRLWEIEGGERRGRFDVVDLAQLCREVGETLRPVAEDRADRLTVSAVGAAPVRGDVRLLRQMVVNLVENAIRHTPEGALIAIDVRHDASRVEICVADDGPGIPLEAHATVILRFGRLESAEDRPGHGLGLTLVDAIARLHGGLLRLEDAAPGLRAVVTLPAVA